MTATRSLCLSLELDLEDERVAGRLEDEHGNDWPFSCWLDLLTLIDRVNAGGPLRADQLERAEGHNHERAELARVKGAPASAARGR
jgi:hypothetical protein